MKLFIINFNCICISAEEWKWCEVSKFDSNYKDFEEVTSKKKFEEAETQWAETGNQDRKTSKDCWSKE